MNIAFLPKMLGTLTKLSCLTIDTVVTIPKKKIPSKFDDQTVFFLQKVMADSKRAAAENGKIKVKRKKSVTANKFFPEPLKKNQKST